MRLGNEKAALELYNELSPKLFGFCMNRLGNRTTAEDLTQEIFIKVVEKIESYNPERGNFTSWFWQLARNTLIDHYRKPKDVPFSDLVNENSEDESDTVERLLVGDAAKEAEQRTMINEVMAVLQAFSDEEQELFRLRYVAELSYKDIASVLNKPEGSLRVASLRLKEKMRRKLLNEHGN